MTEPKSEKQEREPLWGEMKLPYVEICAELGEGKTMWLLSIKPEETLYIGLEFSGENYHPQMGTKAALEAFDEIQKIKKSKQNPSLHIWRWFERTCESIKPGEYRVLAIDTNGDLQDGLPDHVATLHEDYGFKSEEKFRAMGGVFWKCVRTYLEQFLHRIRMEKGIETIAWASHMRNVWEGGSATDKREAQGFQSWHKIAFLSIELRRKVKNGEKEQYPYGLVNKHRLAVRKRDEHGNPVSEKNGDPVMVSILPRKIEKCTPGRIREYIASPAYSRRLKASEKYEEPPKTEAEILELRARAAQMEAEAAQAKADQEREKRMTLEAADSRRRANLSRQESSSRRAAESAAAEDEKAGQPKEEPKEEPKSPEKSESDPAPEPDAGHEDGQSEGQPEKAAEEGPVGGEESDVLSYDSEDGFMKIIASLPVEKQLPQIHRCIEAQLLDLKRNGIIPRKGDEWIEGILEKKGCTKIRELNQKDALKIQKFFWKLLTEKKR